MFSTHLRPPLVRLCYPSPLVLRSPNTFDSTEGWPKDLDDETYIDPPEGVGSNTGLSQQYSGPELRASSVGLGNEHYQSQEWQQKHSEQWNWQHTVQTNPQALHDRNYSVEGYPSTTAFVHAVGLEEPSQIRSISDSSPNSLPDHRSLHSYDYGNEHLAMNSDALTYISNPDFFSNCGAHISQQQVLDPLLPTYRTDWPGLIVDQLQDEFSWPPLRAQLDVDQPTLGVVSPSYETDADSWALSSTKSEEELFNFCQGPSDQLDALSEMERPFGLLPFLTAQATLPMNAKLDFRCSALPFVPGENIVAANMVSSPQTIVYSQLPFGSSVLEIDPSDIDMSPADIDMTPSQTHSKNPDHLYMPRWTRGNGKSREGWCGICRPGLWLSLKRSTYWYHKNFVHGVTVTGDRLPQPLNMRSAPNSKGMEGLCGTCGTWITLGRGKRSETSWYRHAYKCGSLASKAQPIDPHTASLIPSQHHSGLLPRPEHRSDQYSDSL